MGLFRFYRECFSRAFTGKFFLIEKWSGGLGLLTLLMVKFVPIPDGIQAMISEDVPLYFFLIIFFGTVFLGFVTAPYTIYKEEREKAHRLEEARKPRLKVFVGERIGTREYTGLTNQFVGGRRSETSIFSTVGNALSLVVQNVGETRIEKCTANLVWAECVDGEKYEPIEILEPILLPWDHADYEGHLQASIDPNSRLRIWIAEVNNSGWAWLLRDKDKLPPSYQKIFGPSGRYRAIIQVVDGQSLSIETRIEIVCSESKPGEFSASISILEQDSEPLQRSGIAT